ncbi:protein phosphatase 1 regulatory subunit 3F [Macrochelys suwanniensis]
MNAQCMCNASKPEFTPRPCAVICTSDKWRPCEEEPSDEDVPNPAGEEEGSPDREPGRESPPAPTPQPTGQVPELPEPPARESPPLPVAPGGSRGPEAWSSEAGPGRAEEEAVDLELEQLYLSHLSRLRAEELGGTGGRPGGREGAGSPLAWLRGLSDRDLVVGWAGPERALNSGLAQEITRRYEGADRGPHAGPGRDSPPALLEGGGQGAGPGGAPRLRVVPARTAAPAGPGHGGWGGPRGLQDGGPGCPPRLGPALTRSLLVLGLVVLLPVVLSGCLPAAAVTLYVVLAWRQAS